MRIKLKPIDEQVVVLVGATSGIGRETAQHFARRGAQVVIAGRDQTAVNRVVDEIRAQGGEATGVVADVTDYDQMRALVDAAVQTYGRIDTWVHLAAVSLYSRFEDTRPDEFRRVVEVNLLGQMYGALAALPHLKREGRGALIHVSSIESQRSFPYQSAYAASKHGIPGFLDSLRVELRDEGMPISVTNIMPGSINTPLFSKALTRMGVKPKPYPPVYEPEVVSQTIIYAATHPVRELYVGGAARSFGMMQRAVPKYTDQMIAVTGFEGQRTDVMKGPEAPHNLYEHIQGHDTVHGEYGDKARGFSLVTWLRIHPWVRRGLTAAVLIGGGLLIWQALIRRNRFGDADLHDRRALRELRERAAHVGDSQLVKQARSLPQQARRIPGSIFPIRPRRRIGPVVLPGRYGPVKLKGQIGPVRIPDHIGPIHLPERLQGYEVGPYPLPRVFAARLPMYKNGR